MEVQLLAQLYIQTLVAGVTPNEWSEKCSFEAHLIPFDGLQDVRWNILYWVPTCITAM